MVNYSGYEGFIKSILDTNDLTLFKFNRSYREILEHVDPDYGKKYLDLIRSLYKIQDTRIQEFCNLNDKIGSPAVHNMDNITGSPTSLRYIFHALKVLEMLNNDEIVEIGGGYGGLALAINFFDTSLKIKKYNFIDLPGPLELQRRYLSNFKFNFEIKFFDADKFGQDICGNNFFLISSYSFSELRREFQLQYAKHIIARCDHGFLAWSLGPLFDFGKIIKHETAYPFTGADEYVYF
jgi:hypothetical protein